MMCLCLLLLQVQFNDVFGKLLI